MEKEYVEKILTSSEYIKFNGWVKPDKYGFQGLPLLQFEVLITKLNGIATIQNLDAVK